MNIETTEQAIIDRLKAQVIGPAVEPFPDDPTTYVMKHAKGALLVHYQGSAYTEPNTYFVSQIQQPEFDITIITKNLRTHTGAYTYLEAVKSALTGFEIPGEAKLYPKQDGFFVFMENKKEWQYKISFAFRTTHEEQV